MIQTIVGIILLAAPFLLVSLFPDKKKGFVYVFFCSLLLHAAFAFILQIFGIFYYWTVVLATILADAAVVFVFFKKAGKCSVKGFFNWHNLTKKIDWIAIFVFFVAALSLYQVHYNYTGKINLATDLSVQYHQVKNMAYPYPYFSDEWYSVSLIEGAITKGHLPVHNLLVGAHFVNLELFFSSLLAHLIVLLGLVPLLQYTVLSIIINALIILLAYILMSLWGVPKLLSGISSFLLLYITAGANLPGFWHLIPFTFGLLFFLQMLLFMQIRNYLFTILAAATTTLFYPPLFPFVLVVVGIFSFANIKIPKEKFLRIFAYFIIPSFLILLAAFIVLLISPAYGIVKYLFSRIFFTSFTAPLLPKMSFFNIIPILSILTVAFGLQKAYSVKNWTILGLFFTGAGFWAVYSLTFFRFFIEYERVVIFISIIVVLISALGLQKIEEYFSLKFKNLKILKIIEACMLVAFLAFVPFYTRANNWESIKLINPLTSEVFFPKSPANNYLTDDDIVIFSSLRNKKFLSFPWKGTVIGVSSQNHPFLSKEGTISLGKTSFLVDFISGSCEQKEAIAKRYKIEYIYLYKFDCENFRQVAESREGFVLYILKQ